MGAAEHRRIRDNPTTNPNQPLAHTHGWLKYVLCSPDLQVRQTHANAVALLAQQQLELTLCILRLRTTYGIASSIEHRRRRWCCWPSNKHQPKRIAYAHYKLQMTGPRAHLDTGKGGDVAGAVCVLGARQQSDLAVGLRHRVAAAGPGNSGT